MEKYYCETCGEPCYDDELVPETEPHGEVLRWTPCCKAGPIPAEDYDPTPYCHTCGAMSADKCDCGPIARNH